MQQLFEEYKESTASLQEFARKKGVSYSTLVYWFYHRGKAKDAEPDRAFVEVSSPARVTMMTAGHYRVELPGGIGLSFSGPVRREDLEQLLLLLRS